MHGILHPIYFILAFKGYVTFFYVAKLKGFIHCTNKDKSKHFCLRLRITNINSPASIGVWLG